MKKIFLIGLLILFLCCITITANATLIDDTYAWQNEKVIDFSEFYPNYVQGGDTNTQIGTPNGDDIRWNGSRAWSNLGYGGAVLGTNGQWQGHVREGFANLGAVGGHMTFTFDSALTTVGGFINHLGDDITYILALDINGLVLENHIIAIDIGNYHSRNDGELWGIHRIQADIYGLRVQNGGVVLDDLTYSYANSGPPSVPEPATILLLFSGIGVLCLKLRKHKSD